MRTQIRIVAGSLRGRKLTCDVNPNLRPTPQMVREALFSLLVHHVPDRLFIDIFAGTGANGLEAISRGGKESIFLELDHRLIADLHKHLKDLKVEDKATVLRADAYRWVQRWQPPSEPVNIFISPPFRDFTHRLDSLLEMIRTLQEKVAVGSMVVLQGEHDAPLENLPDIEAWDDRRYGRNHLLLREKLAPPEEEANEE